jgi:ElaB/YqjD/DUF883 family membrane-anchored ribosome-binding protein
MAQETYESRDTRFGRSAAEEAKDMASQQAQRVASQVEGAAQAVAEQGRQIQDNVQVVANNFRTAFEKSMRDQPYTTLAMAAGIAFVLGAIWKS